MTVKTEKFESNDPNRLCPFNKEPCMGLKCNFYVRMEMVQGDRPRRKKPVLFERVGCIFIHSVLPVREVNTQQFKPGEKPAGDFLDLPEIDTNELDFLPNDDDLEPEVGG